MMEEYFQLDQLTLGKLSKAQGKALDKNTYLASLLEAKNTDCLFDYRKEEKLLGYASLKQSNQHEWFVLMFNTHPQHRTATVFRRLFKAILNKVISEGGQVLVSNVYKNNLLSINFHKRLGFVIARENEFGYEFRLPIHESKNCMKLVAQ